MTRRARWMAVVTLVTGALLRGSTIADAQDLELGQVRIVDGAGDPVAGGGSRDPFTLDLPAGAACPGDSADDGYRVSSYMVPASVHPGEVTYDGLGPSPRVHGRYEGFQQPLYDVTSAFFVSALTADAEEPGAPGLIAQPPMFDLAVYAVGDLPAGAYRIGIACTLSNDVVRVWDTQLRVVEDAADEPAGVRWEAVGVAQDGGSGGSTTAVAVAVALGIAGAAGAAGLVLIRRRQAPVRTSASREEA